MASKHSLARYRNWYAKLLRLYPKPYRERFGEGMEQTFNDLCHERVQAERGLFSFALWMFFETSAAILRENATTIMRSSMRRGSTIFLRLVISLLNINMKTHRILGLAALVVFIISFFLPAFEGMSGFASFAYCWDTLLGHEPLGNFRILSGGWFYYSGFVMSNVLFVGLVAALFLTRKIGRLRSVFSLVCFLQALSWLVGFVISGEPSQITAIKVGYYVWLIAYGLLVTAHLWKRMPNLCNQCAAPNHRPAGQPDRSDNLSATLAADRAFLAAELERYREVVAVAQKKRLASSAFAYGI